MGLELAVGFGWWPAPAMGIVGVEWRTDFGLVGFEVCFDLRVRVGFEFVDRSRRFEVGFVVHFDLRVGVGFEFGGRSDHRFEVVLVECLYLEFEFVLRVRVDFGLVVCFEQTFVVVFELGLDFGEQAAHSTDFVGFVLWAGFCQMADSDSMVELGMKVEPEVGKVVWGCF